MNRSINICIMTFILCVFSCSKFNDELIEVTIINEIQECEELNMHYKIINSSNMELVDTLILPYLDKFMNNEENNELFFKAFDTIPKELIVSGYLSKKPHKEVNIGCSGALYFKIKEVKQITKPSKKFNMTNSDILFVRE